MQTFLKGNWYWILGVLALSGYLGFALQGGHEQVLMPGVTTHGHYQIELDCAACHTPNMGVKQESCNECHAEELERVDDSHPVIKFRDPRNAERLAHLDARYCITCHREHQPELTGEMGLTLPTDYCYHCHENIAEERPTHQGMGFDTCATAGCHNFHDNTGLYERFLVDHLDEPDFKPEAYQRVRDYYMAHYGDRSEALEAARAEYPHELKVSQEILHDWSATSHAAAGVNCRACHDMPNAETGAMVWVDKPNYESCQKCHDYEVKGFLEGRHGMRLARGLSPMTPGMARLPMKSEAAHFELSCMSCHSSHEFNTTFAAVDACLQCHNDDHSLAYKESPHFDLFTQAKEGLRTPNEAVSCATCHLPRVEVSKFGETLVRVDHNQNNSLRPNDKMVRAACINCHGLQFSLNALSDQKLIRNNFNGQPEVFVESLEMAREEKERTEASRR
ncbi:cytochrome c3 family protein [Cerasicoccus frondis]|uniref:cytochrome c3 family protein n=1 Tax=Cerasicoccus frondis TaxID=490090 RepID=UPI002852BEA0|nr:cytochrome c3 family protein [Cerasicoccus frondis]